ncbi:DUF551 domain-containing protein [Escherichia coli]|nr:DUF551 domain-containing protein [Escherichia coli]EEX8385295.1 DUF551 domain-containing protein [Escherichia coli]EEY5507011.1 DUF551 domain-containing protein [Escherichia coli]EHZ3556751.1 DUF551 domain-containing protein [Escherichia coli]EIF2391391.1 DUF551 domain-containing protein [Escherichia coli]
MTTITKERIELFIKNPLENGLTRGEQMELARIALASLEAEPDYIRYECCRCGWETIEDWRENDVCPKCNHKPMGTTALYTATPAPAVPAVLERLRAIVADPRALPRRKEWVSGQQYSYVLLENVEAMVDEACHAAMLQGSQPVSQTYKLPVNTPCQDAPAHIWLQTAGVWPEDGELSELTWCSHNQHHDDTLYVRADLVNGNSPVTPDGWISCSDRMPEKGQNVLISVNFDSSLVEPLICSARYTGSTFRRGDATIKPGNGIEQATHWMPLPEPPQEVK